MIKKEQDMKGEIREYDTKDGKEIHYIIKVKDIYYKPIIKLLKFNDEIIGDWVIRDNGEDKRK